MHRLSIKILYLMLLFLFILYSFIPFIYISVFPLPLSALAPSLQSTVVFLLVVLCVLTQKSSCIMPVFLIYINIILFFLHFLGIVCRCTFIHLLYMAARHTLYFTHSCFLGWILRFYPRTNTPQSMYTPPPCHTLTKKAIHKPIPTFSQDIDN